MARIDNLEFLSDVIPQVLATKQPRETKPVRSKKKQSAAAAGAGQSTLGALFKLQTAAATPQSDQEPDSASDHSNSNSASREDKGKSVLQVKEASEGRDGDEEGTEEKDTAMV